MTYQDKKFVVIGAGELQIPLIQAAKSLGLKVIATDQNSQAIGAQFADELIIADTMNAEETLQQIIKYTDLHGTIHGVATSGTDASFTTATIAQYFSLPGHDPQAALCASDKILMRHRLEQQKVSIPKYKVVSSLEDALLFFNDIQSPCVLKPTRNMGARGISLVSSEIDITLAFELAQVYNRNRTEMLIEEYINAHELSIDALVQNDNIVITGIADRIIEYPPFFVETGHILPSQLDPSWLERAVATFKEGIKALGLTHGAAKADLKVSANQTWVIEIAARLSGGFMSSHTFPFATGINLQEYMVKLALGEELPQSIQPEKKLVSIERALIFAPGIIKDISLPENILDQEYISHLSLRAKIGDTVVLPQNNLDKQGNIIATAPTRELALRAINSTIQMIKISIEETNSHSEIIDNSNKKAKKLLEKTCNVCSQCNGIWCKGKIPGVGGVGTGEGFIQAYDRFRHIKIIPHYIHDVRKPDTKITMFGRELSMPVFTAPIGGAHINYTNSISELNFQRAFIKGANQAGTLAFMPDPASYELFPNITQAILENFGQAIFICKPREDLKDMKIRFEQVIKNGVLGIGTDIDGIGLKTFSHFGYSTCPKSISELQELSSVYNLPFVIKGILSPADAHKAIESGATHIVVSSHGGRIGEAFPLPIDILPMIKDIVGDRVTILLDGAIRSGADVIKALLLGADGVLIGRTVAIHAVGGGHQAVTAYLNLIRKQIESQMLLLGVSNIHELKSKASSLLWNNNLQNQ